MNQPSTDLAWAEARDRFVLDNTGLDYVAVANIEMLIYQESDSVRLSREAANFGRDYEAKRTDILKLNAKKLPKTITVLSDECNEQGW